MKKSLLVLFIALTVSAAAQPFRCVVAVDGSGTHTTIQAALDACPENAHSIVFVKNGVYAEQVTLGTKTATSTKRISLIGESYDGVRITHSQSRASSGSPTFEDICTVKLYANDFYAENITIENAAGNTGMAEALYTAGDRQTFKNCKLISYQDTYRSKKGTRGYFKNCWIEGAVDFIYAGGVLFFDDCTINSVAGGYITAPEDAAYSIPRMETEADRFMRLGFIFRNCNITANSNVAANSCYLGRPWNTNAGTFYLNCTLGAHINSLGWKDWGGRESSASFAEYKSKDTNGNLLDVTQRVSWSFQLTEADANLFTPQGIYARVSSTVYDPMTICIAPQHPSSQSVNGNIISWNTVENVAGYVVMKNGSYFASTTETTLVDITTEPGTYVVKSVGLLGQLSSPETVSGVSKNTDNDFTVTQVGDELLFSEPVRVIFYNFSGAMIGRSDHLVSRMNRPASERFIVQATTASGDTFSKKIILTHK